MDNTESQCGYPMSSGVKSAGFSLGKSSRDLACQVYPYLAFLVLFQLQCKINNLCGFIFVLKNLP
jgi:hypothetical protein